MTAILINIHISLWTKYSKVDVLIIAQPYRINTRKHETTQTVLFGSQIL